MGRAWHTQNNIRFSALLLQQSRVIEIADDDSDRRILGMDFLGLFGGAD